MKLIGKGLFTKAYLNDNGEVILHSVDHIKECMAYGWFPDSPLFPEIKFIDRDDISIYEMKYYPKVRSLKNNLKPKQYEIYKELRVIYNDFNSFNVRDHDLHQEWHKAFDKIRGKRVREALKDALDACANYGTDIMFEISPRNVAVDKGKLILLDCFFIVSQMREIRR